VTSTLAGTLLPLAWLLARPGHLGPIWFAAMMEAFTWGAITPALFNLSLATAPRERRTAYLAVLGMCNGIAGFASSLLSGQVMGLLPERVPVFGFEWTNYHSIILASAAFRVLASRMVWLVHEPRAWGAGRLLRAMLAWPLERLPWIGR
jgi:hypothetical protein